MIISIVNGTDLPKEEIQRTLRAVNRQLAEDFKKYWHRDVQLRLEGWTGEQPDPSIPLEMRGDAVIYLWDEPDVAGALGYHERSGVGVPYGFVFRALSESLGQDWSVSLSHEALELAMDPEANLLARGPHPDPQEHGRRVYHWYELCDAVQNESYEIDGVKVSDFLLPLYFTEPDELQNHNDFLGTSVPSFGVAPGGYVGFFDPVTQRDATYTRPDDALAARRLAAKQALKKVTRTGRHGVDGNAGANFWTRLAECDAITFKLRTDGSAEAAEEVARRILGAGWNVSAVAATGDEFDAVCTAPARPTFAEAWELAHAIADDEAVVRAEPSLSFPVVGESDDAREDPADEGGPSEAPRRMSSSGTTHLPGTERANWSLELCRVPGAWHAAEATLGRGVRIGHPDSGYRPHPEMDADRVLADIDYDFLDRDTNAASRLANHGLSTASVIMSGRSGRIVGSAPSAEILPLRVTKARGLIPAPVLFGSGMRRVRDAIDYAIRQNCGVISMSLGGPFGNGSLLGAIRRAREHGLIVLAAAGNVVHFVTYPARWPDVIAVGGCNIERHAWSGSCRGPAVDITAPAESVWRAFCNEKGEPMLGRSSGTSYAVALTAGVAALWLARHGHRQLFDRYGGAGVQDVFLQLVQQTAQKNHHLPAGDFGAGILDAQALLEAELPAEIPTRRASLTVDPGFERIEGVDLGDLPDGLAREWVSAMGLRESAAALVAAPELRARTANLPLEDGVSARLRERLLGKKS